VYLILDDSEQGKGGRRMETVAKMKDPTTDVYIRSHQYVYGTLLSPEHVIPWGLRRYAKQGACAV
jgi:hypothetical protein